MERLVEWNCKEKGSALPKCINEFGDTVLMEDICAQLATIYDILGDDYNLDRLQELVDADKDGRCVVLPCKVGDTLYTIDSGDYKSGYKPYARDKEVTEISWKMIRGRDLGLGLILKGGDFNTSARYKISSIGKTVFLTREEAEAKLIEEEQA